MTFVREILRRDNVSLIGDRAPATLAFLPSRTSLPQKRLSSRLSESLVEAAVSGVEYPGRYLRDSHRKGSASARA